MYIYTFSIVLSLRSLIFFFRPAAKQYNSYDYNYDYYDYSGGFGGGGNRPYGGGGGNRPNIGGGYTPNGGGGNRLSGGGCIENNPLPFTTSIVNGFLGSQNGGANCGGEWGSLGFAVGSALNGPLGSALLTGFLG